MNNLAATLDHPTAQKGTPSCWWAPFPRLDRCSRSYWGKYSWDGGRWKRVINHKEEA